MDWSSAAISSKQVYKDTNGKPASLEQIYKMNGVTVLRQRLWAGSNQYDLKANLYLAKRAKAANMKLYISVFFNNGWTDRGQFKCWDKWGNTVPSISRGIYDYFLGIGNALAAQGTAPDYLSLGNEITSGVCSLGDMSTKDGPTNTAIFLQSAADGIRDSHLGSSTSLMLHLDKAADTGTYTHFIDAILQTKKFDFSRIKVIGMSAYPYYDTHGNPTTQANLANSIKTVRQRYKTDVMIVESGWPQECEKPKHPFPGDTKSIQYTVDGQAKWIKLLAETAKSAGATSTAYWEGAWLNNPNLGSSCNNVLLFDPSGKALPSLAAFKVVRRDFTRREATRGMRRQTQTV